MAQYFTYDRSIFDTGTDSALVNDDVLRVIDAFKAAKYLWHLVPYLMLNLIFEAICGNKSP